MRRRSHGWRAVNSEASDRPVYLRSPIGVIAGNRIHGSLKLCGCTVWNEPPLHTLLPSLWHPGPLRAKILWNTCMSAL